MTYGIAMYEPEYDCNMGSVIRAARCFGASYAVFIGSEYTPHPTAVKHDEKLPTFSVSGWSCFESLVDEEIIPIEIADHSTGLYNFIHPTNACYLLGNEGRGIPDDIVSRHRTVSIPSNFCLNVAAAGNVVLSHRYSVGPNREPLPPTQASADVVAQGLDQLYQL